MCVKFHVSRVSSRREKPFGGVSIFVTLDISSIFLLSFQEFKFLFLNQHVPSQLSLPADDWRQQFVCLRHLISYLVGLAPT